MIIYWLLASLCFNWFLHLSFYLLVSLCLDLCLFIHYWCLCVLNDAFIYLSTHLSLFASLCITLLLASLCFIDDYIYLSNHISCVFIHITQLVWNVCLKVLVPVVGIKIRKVDWHLSLSSFSFNPTVVQPGGGSQLAIFSYFYWAFAIISYRVICTNLNSCDLRF